jgi:hypothetical protein
LGGHKTHETQEDQQTAEPRPPDVPFHGMPSFTPI